jgi:heptaprenyl diphosphate synthase
MTKRTALFGVLIAQAILMGYMERMIPLPIAVPGVKLGLSNVVVVLTLYIYGPKEAIYIGLIKSIVVASMFGGVSSVMYSLSGTTLSLFAMITFKKFKVFSEIGVSIIGGVFHNLGQIIMVSIIINNYRMFYYFPILIWSGIITGYIVGYIAFKCLQNIQVYVRNNTP